MEEPDISSKIRGLDTALMTPEVRKMLLDQIFDRPSASAPPEATVYDHISVEPTYDPLSGPWMLLKLARLA
jgi:hypothetical protein